MSMVSKLKIFNILLGLLMPMSMWAEVKNLHETISDEFEIYPPALEFGYPLWFQYDTLPITAVIFLKRDLSDLYRMDRITYVAEPTEENARIIEGFSGDRGRYPKYFIVPDSNLTWKEVEQFLEYLTPKYWESNFCLVGSNKYFNLKVKDQSMPTISPPIFRINNSFHLLNNCKNEILFEGEFMDLDSIPLVIESLYWSNYVLDTDYTLLERRDYGLEQCLQNSRDIKSFLNEPDQDSILTIFLNEELAEQSHLLNLVNLHGSLRIPDKSDIIQVQFARCERLVGTFYNFIDKMNQGVLLSRNNSSEYNKLGNYIELYRNKKDASLSFIHTEFPDLITHSFQRFPDPLPTFDLR